MDDHKKSYPASSGKAEQELLDLEELLESSAASGKGRAEEDAATTEAPPDTPYMEPEAHEPEEDGPASAPSRIMDFDFSDMDELHRRALRSEVSASPASEEPLPSETAPVPEVTSIDPEIQPAFQEPVPLSTPGREATSEPFSPSALEPEPETMHSPEQQARPGGSTEMGDCDPLPRYDDFIFQSLHGRFLFSGSFVHSLQQGDSVPEYCPFVVDFFDSPGPGVLMVEGVHKYAPVLGRRKLQQQGEITDEFLLRPLQSLKVGRNETSLFYQLVPRAGQGSLFKEFEDSPEGFLLHDTVTMLHGLLRNMKQEGPTALALHLPEAVLLVAGDKKRVVWARRYTLAGDDLNAIRDGFEIIAQDLHNVRRDSGVRVREVIWVETFARELQWPDFTPEELHFTRMPVFALQDDLGPVFSALPGIMPRVGGGSALTEPAERVLVNVGRWEKTVLSLLLVLSLMVGGAGYWLQAGSVDLDARKQELSHMKHRLTREYSSVSESIGFLKKDSAFAAQAGQIAEQVGRAGKSSPLGGIWNGLAELRPKPCRVQALEVTYERDLARIRMEGVVDLGLTQAQAAYSEFLTALERGGFRIERQSFQLDVDSNFFSLVLEKRFSE